MSPSMSFTSGKNCFRLTSWFMNGIMMTPTTGTLLCARPMEQPTMGLDGSSVSFQNYLA